MATQELTNYKYVSMREYTTLQMGGPAKLFQPTSQDGLVEILQQLRKRHTSFHVLGKGSNLLVNDAGLELPVVCTRGLRKLEIKPPYVKVEAGYPLPKLVRAACLQNLGGIEYLASVPGTVGGGICMNAGRGAQHERFFHQVVESVTCHDGKRAWTFGKRELRTGFRWSRFCETPELCVISACLKLEPRDSNQVQQQITKRLQFARAREDHSGPNAGSVFRMGKNFQAFQDARLNGVCFSTKTPNWIINHGGTFQAALRLIHSVGTESELEWSVWSS